MTFYSLLFSFFTIHNPSSQPTPVTLYNSQYIFQPIADLHLSLLQNDIFARLPMPYPYETKSSPTKNAVIETLLFQNKDFRKVRLTLFSSEEEQFFQSVWYPQEYNPAPIMTIDLVHFGKNKSFCFVNFIDAEPNTTDLSPFLNIKRTFSMFSKKIIRSLFPFYTLLSDAFLYGNIHDDSLLHTLLPDVLEKYISNYRNLSCVIEGNNQSHYKKQKEYNRIRRVIDSGIFLKDIFDITWFEPWLTEIYTNEDF